MNTVLLNVLNKIGGGIKFVKNSSVLPLFTFLLLFAACSTTDPSEDLAPSPIDTRTPADSTAADSAASSLRLMGDTAWHVYKSEYFSL